MLRLLPKPRVGGIPWLEAYQIKMIRPRSTLSTFVFYENGWEGPHSFKQGAIWGIAVTLEIAAVFIWIHVEADIEDRDRPDLAEEPLSCKKTNEDDSVNNSEIAV